MGFDVELKIWVEETGFVFVMKEKNGPGHPDFSFKSLNISSDQRDWPKILCQNPQSNEIIQINN